MFKIAERGTKITHELRIAKRYEPASNFAGNPLPVREAKSVGSWIEAL